MSGARAPVRLPDYIETDRVDFWHQWNERFLTEQDTFITPEAPAVTEAVTTAIDNMALPPTTKAMRIWDHVDSIRDYKLSKEWKTPTETINEPTADCEDVTFLIASMLSAAGVSQHEIHTGYLVFPDGTPEAHTWNVVQGDIIDGTGRPGAVQEYRYDTVTRFTINREP